MARPRLELLAPALDTDASTLGSLCDAVGARLLDVVVAPRGLDVPVSEAFIHDPLEPLRPHAVVLAPVGGVEALLDSGAAAVVVKRREVLPGWMIAAFEAAGVALLVTPSEVRWGDLHVTLCRALPLGEDPATSLDAVADAAAALADGPVTIEDLHGRLLAYSADGQDIDSARIATVLGRRAPARWLRELRRAGVLDRLARSGETVRVELPDLCPRLAAPIRSGGTTVGAIWLAGEQPSLQADAAIRDAALTAAACIARDRGLHDAARRRRAESLRRLLEGVPGELGSPDELAVVAVHCYDATPPEHQRLADLLGAHLRALRISAVTGVLDDRVYAVAPEPGLRRAIGDWLARCSSESAPLRAGYGGPGLPGARRIADLCVEFGDDTGELVDYEAVHGRALVADVTARLAEDGRASPALLTLRRHDDEYGTHYIATLGAFLDSHGNCGRTADALGIHVNTLRYRVGRLAEIASLDLDDPEARLAVAVELSAERRRA